MGERMGVNEYYCFKPPDIPVNITPSIIYFHIAGSGFQDNYIDFMVPQSNIINTPGVWVMMVHSPQKNIFKNQV